MLKPNNLTISIPSNVKCNKDCPYCISKMTGQVKQNISLMQKNLNKVKNISKAAEVTSVLITGKCEPLMKHNMKQTIELIKHFNDVCVELQTNGIYLKQLALNYEWDDLENILFELYMNGLNTLAFSIDDVYDFNEFVQYVFPIVKKLDINIRVTLNVTSKLYKGNYLVNNFSDYIEMCKIYNIDQFTLRKIVAPKYSRDKETEKWIHENAGDTYYTPLINQALDVIKQKGVFQWKTNFGTEIYNIDGVDFTHSEYCIQESSNSEEIRSLVFLEDGHLYPNWYGTGKLL